MEMYDIERVHVASAVKAIGGVMKFSAKFDICEGHVQAVIEGRAKPGPRTLKAVGLKVSDSGEIVVAK